MNVTEYTEDQQKEIELGKNAGIDVSAYENHEFLAIQMRQIRLGLMGNLPVSYYAKPEFDWLQMEEIRKGLKDKVDVTKYADATMTYGMMRQIRKALSIGLDLSEYKNLHPGVLKQMRKAVQSKVDIMPYVKAGYDEEQLEQIRIALEENLTDIKNYVSASLRGASLRQIRLGLEQKVDVSLYANGDMNWQQMREIRLGLYHRLEVRYYLNTLYSWEQMREIRLGLEDGLPIERYMSFMYTSKTMHDIRVDLKKGIRAGTGNNSLIKKQYSEFELFLNENMMEATIFLQDKSMKVDREKLILALEQNNVKKGINYETMDLICEGKSESDIVIIARGKVPEPGSDGWYEFFFDTELKTHPVLLEDGSVDYKNAKWFEMVKQGQKVAYYHFAETGSAGYKVNGEEIPAKKGKEKKHLSGQNFILLKDNQTYLSSIDGKIELKGDNLDISSMLVLEEVNISNGNVSFNGSVYVKGTVARGSQIIATGDIFVDGFTEGAIIEAGGDVILRKGNNADGRGYVKAGGDVCGVFFEAANIMAMHDIKANYCMSSELHAGGKIEVSGRNGVLVGGLACANNEIKAHNVGNQTGLMTRLYVGNKDQITKEEVNLAKKESKVEQELIILKNAYMEFKKKCPKEMLIVNPMYLKLEDAIYTKELETNELLKKKQELENRKKKSRSVKIVIIGNVYPGVNVEINGMLWRSKPLRGVVLKDGNGHVKIQRYA